MVTQVVHGLMNETNKETNDKLKTFCMTKIY